MKLFNTTWSGEATCDDETAEFTDDGDGNLETLEDDKHEGGEDEELADEAAVEEGGVEDDNIKELDELSHDEWNKVLEETALVHEAVAKVCLQILNPKNFAFGYQLFYLFRFENYHLPSSIQQPSLSQLGITCALCCSSRKG